MFALWHDVDRRREITYADRRAVLVLRPDDTGVMAKFRHRRVQKLAWTTVTWVDTRRPWTAHWRFRWGGGTTIDDLLPKRARRTVAMPMWRQAAWARALRLLVAGALTGAAGWAVLEFTDSWGLVVLVAMALLPTLALLLPRLGPVRVRSLDALPLSPRNVVDYASRRLAGVHPETLEEVPHREQVLERIADIRAEYGALKLDIVARIDHPALFDGAAQPTARFLSALVQADDVTVETPVKELEAVASRLEVTFEVAKDHARTVGIAHLPEEHRDDARRAAKVARLAQESPNEGERRAAVAQLHRILESMALYYMPDVDEVRAIEAPSR